MANRLPKKHNPPNPTGKGGFKPGEKRNPGGLCAGEVAKKEFKVHTQASIAEAFSKCLKLSQNELTLLTNNADIPMAEQVVARALLADSKAGVMYNIEKVLERILGKVATKAEITGKDGAPLPAGTINAPVEITEDVIKRVTDNIAALQRHGVAAPETVKS